MAEADSSTFCAEVSQEVKCSICLHIFENPRVLICLHSFCEKCLQVYAGVQNYMSLRCPLCQVETQLLAGVANLRIDHRAVRIIDMLDREKQRQNAAKRNLVCGVCSRVQSDDSLQYTHCLECEQIFCEQCIVVHNKMGSSKNHTVTSASRRNTEAVTSGNGEQENGNKCPTHPENELVLFCPTCMEPLCRQCTITHHRNENNHQYISIEKANVAAMREDLRSRLIQVSDKSKEFAMFLLRVSNIETTFRNNETEFKNSVETALSEYSKKIDEWQRDLFMTREEHLHDRREKLKEIRQRTESGQARAQQCVDKTKHLLKTDMNPVQFLLSYKAATQVIDTIMSETMDQDALGTIGSSAYQLDFRKSNESVNVGSIALLGRGRTEARVQFKSGPYGIVMFRDGRPAVVGRDQNDYVVIKFSVGSVPWTHFALEMKMSQPVVSIASLSDNRMTVVSTDNKGINNYLNPSMFAVQVIGCDRNAIIHRKHGFSCMTTDYTDNIYLLHTEMDPNILVLCILRPDGSHKTSMRLKTSQASLFKSITACSSNPPRVVIAHNRDISVGGFYILDLSGRILHTVSDPSWKKIRVGCDNARLIYALTADEYERKTLQIFNMQGNLVDTLFKKETHVYSELHMAVSYSGNVGIITGEGEVMFITSPRSLEDTRYTQEVSCVVR